MDYQPKFKEFLKTVENTEYATNTTEHGRIQVRPVKVVLLQLLLIYTLCHI